MLIFLMISTIVLWIATLYLGFVLVGALRVVGLLQWRVDELLAITPRYIGRAGLTPGTRAPAFTLPDITGTDLSLHVYAGRKVLLVFTQAGCGPCDSIVPELVRLQRRGGLQVMVVNHGDSSSARLWVAKSGAAFPILVQETFDVSKRYQVFATPFAFVIDAQGTIASKGLASNRQYLAYVLDAARGAESNGDGGGETDEAENGKSQESISIFATEVQGSLTNTQ